jgi:hypothetical protein
MCCHVRAFHCMLHVLIVIANNFLGVLSIHECAMQFVLHASTLSVWTCRPHRLLVLITRHGLWSPRAIYFMAQHHSRDQMTRSEGTASQISWLSSFRRQELRQCGPPALDSLELVIQDCSSTFMFLIVWQYYGESTDPRYCGHISTDRQAEQTWVRVPYENWAAKQRNVIILRRLLNYT